MKKINDFGGWFTSKEANSRERWDICPLGLQKQQWSETWSFLIRGVYPWQLMTWLLFLAKTCYEISTKAGRCFRINKNITWCIINGQLLLFLTMFSDLFLCCSCWKHFRSHINITFLPCRLLKKKQDFGETSVLGWLASTDLILST